MADSTFDALTAVTSLASGDLIAVSLAGAAGSRKITFANLQAAVGAFIGAKVYNDTTQNINNTTAALTFNQEEFDTSAYHDNSTNPSRITIPSGKAGKYLLSAGTFGSGGADWIGFRKNGTTNIRGFQTALSAGFYRSAQALADLAVSDYVEVLLSTTNNINVGHASALDAQSWFAAVLLGT